MIRYLLTLICCLLFFNAAVAQTDQHGSQYDRLLLNLSDKRSVGALPADEGAVGLWHRLLKLQTTASAMHTTAHPDDEHAGLLTWLSRGEGARTTLTTLNRGEAGANAVGPELFDALGMVRTEELRKSARYYGLDDQYFTTLTDYGFSKTLEESLNNWGRENVLEELVRIIRINRPFVVISRFHGSRRDGHGNHQAAGGITPEAVAAAGDPSRFPEQLSEEGLRPWTPLKLYRGGVQERENWHVKIDVGEYSPWLGESYQNFGYFGLSLQRSQTSGRSRQQAGPAYRYYERLDASETQSADFFEGIDTSISSISAWIKGEKPAALDDLLLDIQRHAETALAEFNGDHTAESVDMLAGGLKGVREARRMLKGESEADFLLYIKEKQFEDAIQAALGLRVSALASLEAPAGEQSPWTPLSTMGVVVPGQSFFVAVESLNPADKAVSVESVRLESPAGLTASATSSTGGELAGNEPLETLFEVKVPADAVFSRTYFSRPSIRENRYEVDDMALLHTPRGAPALEAVVRYQVAGEVLEYREVVRMREANFPYGYELQPLKVAPRVVVNASPATRIVPLGAQPAVFDVEVEVLNNDPVGVTGALRLQLPEGWTTAPAEHAFDFREPGQQSMYEFRVTAQGLERDMYTVLAQAEADGMTYEQGYEIVDQESLDRHYLYRPARLDVHGIEVEGLSGMQVGYIMGVGDEVPSGIEQLGGDVTLLAAQDLADGDLSRFDAIVVGTRAYAVRQDLLTYNHRLLAYAQDGGHLIVLYQTQEFVPNKMAPYPAELPRGAEEVSEEDAVVTILEPDHGVFEGPNQITQADFDGWIEQRGSKFFSSWDPAYTALISCHDAGQDPQAGGWLMADYGDGAYTYFAYAIHRQVPFAVPGAYRIFANVLRHGR